MKLKRGDFVETKDVLVSKSKNLYKEGIKGFICKPVRSSEEYVWILPTNDECLREYALAGYPTGILRKDIIKVNGRQL